MWELADGEYDTCPKFGPYVYMPYRRVSVKDNIVRLIHTDPSFERDTPEWLKNKTWAFTVNDFFKVNVIYKPQQESV